MAIKGSSLISITKEINLPQFSTYLLSKSKY
jgi:hypothetical protein